MRCAEENCYGDMLPGKGICNFHFRQQELKQLKARIEELALHNVIVRYAVDGYNAGNVTWEQAMMAAVVHLAMQLDLQNQRLLQVLNESPVPIIFKE